MSVLRGRAWVFGADVNTDVMAPGLYFKSSMDEMARHCLEVLEPRFAREVQPGDIVVAGPRFGVGSAREQAALALKHLGVGAVLAVSFGRIFYRNALNFGLPALFFPAAGDINAGEALVVEPEAGRIRSPDTGREWTVAGIPAHLMDMVAAGGLLPFLKARLGAPATTKPEPR
jgi:3-isopropylmalate/(R)-2-methylmalate dehydratase small subunit